MSDPQAAAHVSSAQGALHSAKLRWVGLGVYSAWALSRGGAVRWLLHSRMREGYSEGSCREI